MDMAGREITIDTPDGQIYILLPVGIEVPEWGFVGETGLTEAESEITTDACTHAPIMHKLSGGCYAPGCECDKTRYNSECERAIN